jgi:glycosyltransferase involved in cell wall biosynthesis
MSSPLVTVVIPAYNGTDHLSEAIQSVLNQTYSNFELIVVDDASPDHTAEVVKQFNHPRLKYIRHDEHRGAIAARHTGVCASSGEIIAFLDQDDLFHPEKLRLHVAFLEEHPEVGVAYNSRFELDDLSEAIQGIWRPPETVTLGDLVLGFPFAPSDTVLRRVWALREEIWDDSFAFRGDEIIFNGGEYVFCGRLALAGCRFASVGRALNYRRYYARRNFKKLSARCKAECACQEIVFADPRCPDDVVALRSIAFMNTYLDFAYYAFAQDEIGLGQEFIREAVQLNPSILDGRPSELIDFLAATSISDESRDHESLLQNIFAHLPPEIALTLDQYNWAVARGYLLKGTRAIMWGRPEEGRLYFAQAAESGAEIDQAFVQGLTHQLLTYEIEFGPEATQEIVRDLAPYLGKIDGGKGIRSLKGGYWVNHAFQSFRAGEYDKVFSQAIRAVASDPKYLANRGVLSILLRSMVGR